MSEIGKEDEEWRHWALTTLAEDMPAAYPRGPSHAAGSKVYLAALTRDRLGRALSFTVPAPAALALSIATSAAVDADEMRDRIRFASSVSPVGRTIMVDAKDTSLLYDFFEACMKAVTFSVNALELHCNQVIANSLPNGAQYEHKRGRKTQLLDGKQAQRTCYIEEKVAVVLPTLLSIPSPHDDSRLWAAFLRLKRVRNSTIHMNAEEAYLSDPLSMETRTFFDEFMSSKSIASFPRLAIELLRSLQKPGEPAHWVARAEARLNVSTRS